MMLPCPDCLTLDERGLITRIACKLCGEEIAGLSEQGQLLYHFGYTEAKLAMSDNSSHITHLCARCLISGSLEGVFGRELLTEMARADIQAMLPYAPGLEPLLARKALRIVKVSTDRKGLL